MNLKKYIINGIAYNVSVNSLTDDKAEVTVNGVTYQVDIENVRQNVPATDREMEPAATVAQTEKEEAPVALVSGEGRSVCSPLPGVVLGIKVRVGEHIKVGQTVVVLEAMKMENDIQSEYEGIVASINVSEGDSILEGATMITIR